MKVSYLILNCCCCSVTKSCLVLWDPLDCSVPRFPILLYLLEFAQTHVHCVNDAIQPSHFLLPPFSTAFNIFQHQGLFQWVSCLHQVAKGLELQLQHQSCQWIFRKYWFPLGVTGLISLQSRGFSSVFSSTTVWRHQFFGAQPLWSSLMVQLSHLHMTTRKTTALTIRTIVGKVSAF